LALRVGVTAKAGDGDQLFGSVTSRDIAAELEKLGHTIDRHRIVIHSPIRSVGEHEVTLHIHRDIDVPLKVQVLAEGREEVVEVAAEEAEPDAEADSETEESEEEE